MLNQLLDVVSYILEEEKTFEHICKIIKVKSIDENIKNTWGKFITYKNNIDSVSITVIKEILNDLCFLSQVLFDAGKWQKSKLILNNILEIVEHRKKDFLESLNLIYITLGRYYIYQKNYQLAIDNLIRAVESIDNLNSKNYLEALYNMGLAFSKSGKQEEADKYFLELERAIKNFADKETKAIFQTLLDNQYAFICLKKKDYSMAKRLLENSLEFTEFIPQHFSKAEAYRTLGMVSVEEQKFHYAEQLLEKSLQMFLDCGFVFEKLITQQKIALLRLEVGEIEEADFQFEQVISNLENLNINIELPIAYSYRAKIAVYEENFKLAEDLFFKAMDFNKKEPNDHSLAFCCYFLGQLKLKQNLSFEAQKFFKEALELFQKVNNNLYVGYTYLDWALVKEIPFVIADKYARQGEKLVIQYGTEYDQYKSYLNIGCLHREKATLFGSAQRYFEYCLKILNSYEKKTIELAEVHYEFALLWEKMRNPKMAVDHLNESLEIAEELGLTSKANKFLEKIKQLDYKAAAKLQLKTLKLPKYKTDTTNWMNFVKQEITILFADICDFTTLSEELSVEEISQILNEFYINTTKIVLRHNGQVDKFIGDCIMALFNADGSEENHAQQAVNAALEMMEEINKINNRREKKNERQFYISAGINSGEVLLGSLGTALRKDFTAIGDAVNIASRLEGFASKNEIIISDMTYKKLKEKINAEYLGEKQFKGKFKGIDIWKINLK